MVCPLVPPSLNSKSSLGFIILMIVNILWVLSGEITRYIFIDCNFNRPFFVLSVKSSFLSIYFIRYLYKPKKIQYTSMDEIDEMSIEGFEFLTDEENENNGKKVRFSSTKEIRRLPLRIGREAELARRSYNSSVDCTIPTISSPTLIIICVLLPTWLICSLSYQASLLFTTLSSLNLISATSSIFVLILSMFIPSSRSKVTPLKGFIVLINLFGVSLISQSDSLSSSSIILALFSAFAYAVYLISLSKFVSVYGDIDINFLFGSIGIVSIIISVFLLPVLHLTSLERLQPLPHSSIWIRLILSTILGTLIADRLWMEG
ncbi:hypothetical protein PRIPAC_85100 [Pristionchus pacificus]|uniref:EamA domain-containing protein n=1 Tax=Pristionchus pacificus TaxID=54126 RepID=A0A2A6BDH6_PRIPA|nr:hypothetical protein PRIPAC_85100 [Pristionchus pacificus]|eukprot:PDM63896.1 hypothetical protein PRIPAC_53679 [Pristionchus pacificus]